MKLIKTWWVDGIEHTLKVFRGVARLQIEEYRDGERIYYELIEPEEEYTLTSKLKQMIADTYNRNPHLTPELREMGFVEDNPMEAGEDFAVLMKAKPESWSWGKFFNVIRYGKINKA